MTACILGTAMESQVPRIDDIATFVNTVGNHRRIVLVSLQHSTKLSISLQGHDDSSGGSFLRLNSEVLNLSIPLVVASCN